MSALETNCESAIKAILDATAALSGFDIVHRNEDAAADKDRIVVSASPYENALPGKNPGVVKVFRVPVSVELNLVTRDASQYDAITAAINGALVTACAGQIPDAAAAQWITSFGALTGAQLEQTDTGSDETGGNTRQRVKDFHFLVLNPT